MKNIEGLAEEHKKSTKKEAEFNDKNWEHYYVEEEKEFKEKIKKYIQTQTTLTTDLMPYINQEKENIANLKKNITQQNENIKQQDKNAKNQKQKIECQIKNITKQKEALFQRLVCNKVDGKENHALMIVGGIMMAVAFILMAWSDLLRKSENCEREKALKSLNLTYSFACKHEDVKEKMESIFWLGFASVIFDFLFLLIGFFIEHLPLKERISGLKCLHIYTALEAFAFVVPLLMNYTEMADLKTRDTVGNLQQDYSEIKKIMLHSLTQTYSSDNTTNINTMSGRWNKYFIKYDCCAVNQVIGTTNDFDTTPWCTTSGSCQQANSQIPKTCCKAVSEDDYQNADNICHSVVQIGSFKGSCFTRFTSLNNETIETYQIYVLLTLVFTLGIMKLVASLLVGCICMMVCPCFDKLKQWRIKKRQK